MPPKEKYFADIAEADAELARLKLVEAYLDPTAKDALLAAGLTAGSQVLEIGPGAGSMLRWLPEQVGPSGHVTGLDLNPRFLKELQLPNATVIEGDILAPPSTLGTFDLVYSRYVLTHLPDPLAGLQRIHTLLRPGGRAVTIDPDFRTLAAVDPAYPAADEIAKVRDTAIGVLKSAGIMDATYGPKAAADYAKAGFTDITAQGHTRLMHCATAELAHFPASLAPSQAAIEAYAPDARVNYDVLRKTYEDPAAMMTSSLEVVTAGMRPA